MRNAQKQRKAERKRERLKKPLLLSASEVSSCAPFLWEKRDSLNVTKDTKHNSTSTNMVTYVIGTPRRDLNVLVVDSRRMDSFIRPDLLLFTIIPAKTHRRVADGLYVSVVKRGRKKESREDFS